MVGFESVVNFNSQIQGVVFEADQRAPGAFRPVERRNEHPCLRRCAHPDVVVEPGRSSAVPAVEAGTLRVTRTAGDWTFEYSPDGGTTWQTSSIRARSTSTSPASDRGWATPTRRSPTSPRSSAHRLLLDRRRSDHRSRRQAGSDAARPRHLGRSDHVGRCARCGSVTTGRRSPTSTCGVRSSTTIEIASLTYSVNGENPTTMAVGSTACEVGVSCTRRLATDGAFNADMPSSRLVAGLNTVTLRAVDTDFNVSTIDVPVEWTPGAVAPFPQTVDWTVGRVLLDDVAQVIDGRVEPVARRSRGRRGRLRPADRRRRHVVDAVRSGVPITIHSFDPAGYEAAERRALASASSRTGSVTARSAWSSPSTGSSSASVRSSGTASATTRNGERLEIRDSEVRPRRRGPQWLHARHRHDVRLQAAGRERRRRRWPALLAQGVGTGHPGAGRRGTSSHRCRPTRPSQGSLLLVAHHVDATFGALTVRDTDGLDADHHPGGRLVPGLGEGRDVLVRTRCARRSASRPTAPSRRRRRRSTPYRSSCTHRRRFGPGCSARASLRAPTVSEFDRDHRRTGSGNEGPRGAVPVRRGCGHDGCRPVRGRARRSISRSRLAPT